VTRASGGIVALEKTYCARKFVCYCPRPFRRATGAKNSILIGRPITDDPSGRRIDGLDRCKLCDVKG
jgi:hypothetical protein